MQIAAWRVMREGLLPTSHPPPAREWRNRTTPSTHNIVIIVFVFLLVFTVGLYVPERIIRHAVNAKSRLISTVPPEGAAGHGEGAFCEENTLANSRRNRIRGDRGGDDGTRETKSTGMAEAPEAAESGEG